MGDIKPFKYSTGTVFEWNQIDKEIVEARRVLPPQLYEEWLAYINEYSHCIIDYKHWLKVRDVEPQ